MYDMMVSFISFCLLLLVALSSVCVAVDCPIWFREAEDGTCECGYNVGSAIQYDNATGQVSLALGYCVTYNNNPQNPQVFVGFTNYDYLGGGNRVYTTLPDNVTELNDFMCKNKSRHGFLCGECDPDYGAAINSFHSTCIECKRVYAVGMFILCAIFPMTIFFVIVVMFRLNIPSGPMLGYILFCQSFIVAIKSNSAFFYSMLYSMSYNGNKCLRYSLSVSGVWWYGMAFIYFSKPLCVSQGMSRLQVTCLEYVYVLYPLFLIFITWLCIELHDRNFKPIVFAVKPFHKYFTRWRRNWSASDSIIHAYATFFFLSFISLDFVSFNLLYMSRVYNDMSQVTNTVMVYDPTIELNSPQQLAYAIPAILLLFFLGVCPTLFLCLYPTKLFKKYFKFLPRTQLMLNTFIDTFQSCYKDGLNGTYDFRFLSSAPMLVSLLTFLWGIVYAQLNFVRHVYFLDIFSLITLCLSGTIAYIRPYKTLYMNFSLSFHAAIVSVLSGICAMWYEGHIVSARSIASAYTFFTMLPHFLALATLVYHCLRRVSCINRRMEAASEAFSSLFRRSPENNLTESLPDRLQNSYAYRSIPRVN